MRLRIVLTGLIVTLLVVPVTRLGPGVASPGGAVPTPEPGYHHLGATTAGDWSGVMGRLTVRDPAVRAGTHDFVATRFLAKRDTPGGVAWLEAGWAETGWSGDGRQRIYTFDTNRRTWAFYDQYPVRDGDQVWLYLTTQDDGARALWQAWLWWGDGWHLLTAQTLPLTGHARVEQYVEVYVDPDRGGGFDVPTVAVDNVQVKSAPRGDLRFWREPEVPTTGGADQGQYCLDWETGYDSWSAGTCTGT